MPVNICVSVWFGGKGWEKEKGHQPYFQRAQSLVPEAKHKMLWFFFFLSQQVMFSIMKIPNVRFFSSPSNHVKWTNSSESDFF